MLLLLLTTCATATNTTKCLSGLRPSQHLGQNCRTLQNTGIRWEVSGASLGPICSTCSLKHLLLWLASSCGMARKCSGTPASPGFPGTLHFSRGPMCSVQKYALSVEHCLFCGMYMCTVSPHKLLRCSHHSLPGHWSVTACCSAAPPRLTPFNPWPRRCRCCPPHKLLPPLLPLRVGKGHAAGHARSLLSYPKGRSFNVL